MDVVERVAAAMYNAPDPADPDVPVAPWPPTHEEDVAWWLSLAQAAVNVLQQEQQNTFIAESSAAYPMLTPTKPPRSSTRSRSPDACS